MNDISQQNSERDSVDLNDEAAASAATNLNVIDQNVQGTKNEVDAALDPVVARRKQKFQEISSRREAKEISPFDFDLNFIFQLNEAGMPLTRKDMQHETGGQAVVLTRQDFDALGCLDFIHSSGERLLIEPESLDPNDVLILYPDEVGDEEK